MVAANIFDIIGSGGAGRLHWLLHFNGMPWAVTTSQRLIDGITSAQRRLIFNDPKWIDAGDHYIADEIELYPLLQQPGKLSLKLQPGFGTFTGGDWTAEIADRHVVNKWHGQQRSIFGLEGLTAISDPRQDQTIGAAILNKPFRADDTSIVVRKDIGGLLNTRITAAGPEPYYLWINNECIGSDGIDSLVDGILTISIANSWRGLLRSKNCHHFTNTANSSLVWVSDQPLNGIIGKPYSLWVFAENRDGTFTDPFLFQGKTGLDVKRQGGVWRIQCLPWKAWLDRNVELANFSSTMRRFVFSRGSPTTLRQVPPMRLFERTLIPNQWNRADIWLSAAGFDVTFQTLEEIYAAVASACTTASPTGLTYGCDHGGPFPLAGVMISPPRMNGPLPAILQWGNLGGAQDVDAKWQEKLGAYALHSNPESEWWWAIDAAGYIVNTVAESHLFDNSMVLNVLTDFHPDSPRTNPPYIIQWRQDNGTVDDTIFDTQLPNQLDKFPITTSGPGNQYRIWLDPEIDASDIEQNDKIQLGSKLTTIDNLNSNPQPTKAEAIVDAIGTFGGDPDESYFDIKVTDGGFSPDASFVPFIRGVPTELDPIPPDQSSASYKKFVQGMFLYYIPELHDKDPWAVSLNYTVGPAEKLSYIIRAIVGDNMSVVNVFCPEHVQADDIPDLAPGVLSATWDNQHRSIDWESLDLAVAPGGLSDYVTFRVDLGGKLNLWKFINEELKFYGVVPTWVPDYDTRQMIMRFRRAGTVNGSMAAIGGRRLTEKNISGEDPVDMDALIEQAESWILNAAEIKFGFDPLQDKFLYTWPFRDTSGFAPAGGRTNTMKVAMRMTQINPNAPGAKLAVANQMIGILDRFTRPLPIFRCDAGLHTLLTHGLGVDCLCTYNAVHNPYTGAQGIVEHPGLIVEWSFDPRTNSLSYAVQTQDLRSFGWCPTVIVAGGASTKIDNDNVRIDDIEDNGRAYCGQTDTTAGWYDHWFFDCLSFNQSLPGPVATPGCSCGDYGVIMWTLDTLTPVVYTGVVAKDVSTGDYAAGGPFMVINDPTAGGAFAAFNNALRYGITYIDFDHLLNQPCQKRWVYDADTDLFLEDSAAEHQPARRWY